MTGSGVLGFWGLARLLSWGVLGRWGLNLNDGKYVKYVINTSPHCSAYLEDLARGL